MLETFTATNIKANGAAPGHIATDFNGFGGARTPEVGRGGYAVSPAEDDGSTGAVSEDGKQRT